MNPSDPTSFKLPDKYAFVVGSGRCGTTWVGEWLASHPDCSLIPETYLFCHVPDLTQTSAIWEYYKRGYNGKPVLVDQTHRHSLQREYIRSVFPDAKIIQLVRDGKNVVYSLQNSPWRKNWATPQTIDIDVRHWIITSTIAQNPDENTLVIKYEDLVSDPVNSRKITQLIGIEHHADIVPWATPVNTSHKEHRTDWWKQFSQEDIEKLKPMNGMLIYWGYEPIA